MLAAANKAAMRSTLDLPITIVSGKTLTVSNTLTLAGTDASTLNIGAGGTLGTGAFAAAFNAAAPGAIGGTTPGSGAFTSLSATGATTLPAGSAGTPLVKFSNWTGGYGIYARDASTICITNGTNVVWEIASGSAQMASNVLIGWSPSNPAAAAIDTTMGREGANVMYTGILSFVQASAIGTVASNRARIAAIDVAGTAEIVVKDEAGNQTQISPHAMDAPASLYDADEPWPQVGRESNDFLGLVRYVNHTRLREGRPGWEHIETYAEHNARLNLSGDRALTQLDWDANQAEQVALNDKERAAWKDRRDAAVAKNVEFKEPEPPKVTVKPKPSWLTAAEARKNAQATSRANKATLQGSAFAALKTDLASNVGITINTPAELVGKMDQIIPAAKERRDAKTSTADRVSELEKQVEMLTRFVVFLSRK